MVGVRPASPSPFQRGLSRKAGSNGSFLAGPQTISSLSLRTISVTVNQPSLELFGGRLLILVVDQAAPLFGRWYI